MLSGLPRLMLRCLSVVVILTVSTTVFGQLKADFTADVAAGCSPLAVQFTNKTTGASSSASYSWNFENGTSVLVNPGRTFFDEKNYTVTLTVTDGAQTSVKTMTITVYKKPVADFTANAVKGCLSFPVQFTSTSTPGDGTIANYFWDFGDGTIQSTTASPITHTYNYAQKNTVKLVVSNSFGCQSSTEKKDLIEVLPAIQAQFTSDKNVLCSLSDAVSFTNTSNVPVGSTYTWDFGDQTSSAIANPQHQYAAKGDYTVKLNVITPDGCTAAYILPVAINVANFTLDFSSSSVVCQNDVVSYTANASNGVSNIKWQFSDQAGTSNGSSVSHSFNTAGPISITLGADFGSCPVSVTKNITVNTAPNVSDFLIEPQSFCGAPVTIVLRDTSHALSRAWSIGNNAPFSFVPVTSFTFNSNTTRTIKLTVADANGCKTVISKDYIVAPPVVTITSPDPLEGCPDLKAKFISVSNSATVVDWQWSTVNGQTSTASEPQFYFGTPGTHTVTLKYKTDKGCEGSATISVRVFEKPDASFSALTNVCGNTPVEFTISATVPYNYTTWDFGDNNNSYTTTPNGVTHQYQNDSVYTVQLIVQNGACLDTIRKVNYITVVPPFADVFDAVNTCADTRGLVTFIDSSRKADNWSWDFGDGATKTYAGYQQTVEHLYTKTGTYLAKVSVSKGACTVSDSIVVYVLLKQKPTLNSLDPVVCRSELLSVTVDSLEVNPYAEEVNSAYYFPVRWQYENGSVFNSVVSQTNPWQANFSANLTGGNNGIQKIMLIDSSSYFGCLDTTNLLTVEFRGPQAAFNVLNNDTCWYKPIRFQDASKQYLNVPIQKWDWQFGDGNSISKSTNEIVFNTYPSPANYYATLTVTDAEGCTDVLKDKLVTVHGPKADFSWSPTFITPKSTAQFNNSTATNGTATNYLWSFTYSHTTSSLPNPTKSYNAVGFDTVKLVAFNPMCRDSIVRIVPIKVVTAAFSFTTQYVNNNTCPPMVALFQNLSSPGVISFKWDFGDGSFANNNPTPSHTYNLPGEYTVKLIVFGPGNNSDTASQLLIVKGPFATIKSDLKIGCSPLKVLLTAATKNTTSYIWDFADGTLLNTSDTFAYHTYTTAGVYKPALIMKDATGCAATFTLPDDLLIDSLHAAFNPSLNLVCDSQLVVFNSTSYNFAEQALQKNVSYKWNFGTGKAADTSNVKNPSFFYNVNGSYPVVLTVTSEAGCVSSVTDTIRVRPVPQANINGPANVCTGANVQFTGSSSVNDPAVQWFWDFKNGNTSTISTAPIQTYPVAGNYGVQLILNNKGCYDTAVAVLSVKNKPNINLTASKTLLCLGQSVQLQANDGSVYTWNADPSLSATNIANPVGKPTQTTKYVVTVSSQFSCVSKDSVTIRVAQPFKVKTNADTIVCEGRTVPVNTTGAINYKWIMGVGLSNNNIPNPIASPPSTQLYSVVGYDTVGCFTDTAKFTVSVKPYPTVDAGPSLVKPTGSSFQANATYSSNVAKWEWSPSNYLSCSNCPSPIITPRDDIKYTIKVTSDFGCVASDTFSIKLFCSQSSLFIPNTFTPNGDGMNDIFYIRGKAIKMVKHFMIFNRLGEKIFEKVNVNADDPSQGWDGRYAGRPLSTDVFTYVAELICDTGEHFKVNGTIMIVR